MKIGKFAFAVSFDCETNAGWFCERATKAEERKDDAAINKDINQ